MKIIYNNVCIQANQSVKLYIVKLTVEYINGLASHNSMYHFVYEKLNTII